MPSTQENVLRARFGQRNYPDLEQVVERCRAKVEASSSLDADFIDSALREGRPEWSPLDPSTQLGLIEITRLRISETVTADTGLANLARVRQYLIVGEQLQRITPIAAELRPKATIT